MNELEKLRQTIDEIDCEIAKLYVARLETVKKIGDYKKKNNIAVLDTGREQKVYGNLIECLKEYKKLEFSDDVMNLYKYIMDYSKSKQALK